MSLAAAWRPRLPDKDGNGVKIASTDASVLKRDDGTVGHFSRHAGIVQEIAFQSRLKQGTKMSVTVAASKKKQNIVIFLEGKLFFGKQKHCTKN